MSNLIFKDEPKRAKKDVMEAMINVLHSAHELPKANERCDGCEWLEDGEFHLWAHGKCHIMPYQSCSSCVGCKYG